MTGIPTNSVKVSAAGNAACRRPAIAQRTSFDQRKTVFQDAIDAGYKTGVDGWYSLYCRILPAVLDVEVLLDLSRRDFGESFAGPIRFGRDLGIPLRLILAEYETLF